MSENDTPTGTVDEPVAMQDDLAAIADLLDEPDEPDADDDTQGDESPEADADEAEDAEAGDDDGEEDSADETDEAGEDGPAEVKGGQFAPRSAKVTLPDGRTTTVDELVKGHLRQSDYTRKTQVISEDRKTLDAERERVGQTVQQLSEQHLRLSQMLGVFRPRRPDVSADQDPIGWMKYQQDTENFQAWEKAAKEEADKLASVQQAEAQKQGREYLKREMDALVAAIPAMADGEKRQNFFTEAAKAMSAYGFAREEIGAISDHRFVLVMRDLMRMKRQVASVPSIQKKVEGKPKMVRGSRSATDAAQQGKRARIERLRETGSRADGLSALMDLDL